MHEETSMFGEWREAGREVNEKIIFLTELTLSFICVIYFCLHFLRTFLCLIFPLLRDFNTISLLLRKYDSLGTLYVGKYKCFYILCKVKMN